MCVERQELLHESSLDGTNGSVYVERFQYEEREKDINSSYGEKRGTDLQLSSENLTFSHSLIDVLD
jgi:hypothetical protein